jgi:DNA-nicking Smr family endonuclease
MAMSRDGKRRGLSYEDRVLWTHVTRQIKPLRAEAASAPGGDADEEADAVKPAKKHPPKFVKPAKLSSESSSAAVTAVPAKPSASPFEPLTRRMKQRVARGKHQIDARLDLHGFTQAEAHAALLRFLRSARDRDARLVQVITGKGRGGEIGVLRRQVPHWLGLPEFAELVSGVDNAAIAHGGEGALYVRVRRSRPA